MPYATIFVVALALRLLGLSTQNIWYDEHWTLRVALAPLTQLLDLLVAEEGSKPPIYFGLMHYWVKLGSSEFWLRLPSVLFGSLDAVVAAALGRQLFGARGTALGWLVVLSPFHIYYSQEARPFALWGLFTTTALLFHLRYCATPQRRFLLGYVTTTLLACYTFTYALFFLPLFSALFIWLYRPALSRTQRVEMALGNAVVLLLYLPWLWRILVAAVDGVGFIPLHRGPIYASAAYAVFSLGLGISAGPSLEKLRSLGLSIFEHDALGSGVLVFGFLLVATLVVAGAVVLWKAHRTAFYFATTSLGMFLGTAALMNVLNPEVPLNPRYVLPAILPLMVLILAGSGAAISGLQWQRWLGLAFLLTVSGSLANHYLNPAYERDDLRAAAEFLEQLEPPPEKVLVCGSYLTEVFKHYYQDAIPVEGVSGPLRHESARALPPLYDTLSGLGRFALVYSRPDHGDRDRVLPDAFRSRYRLLHHQHWTGVDLYVFEVPGPALQR